MIKLRYWILLVIMAWLAAPGDEAMAQCTASDATCFYSLNH